MFDELAKAEGISEEEKVDLSGRVSHRSTILRNPERIAMVCADIVDHYLDKFRSLDMKRKSWRSTARWSSPTPTPSAPNWPSEDAATSRSV